MWLTVSCAGNHVGSKGARTLMQALESDSCSVSSCNLDGAFQRDPFAGFTTIPSLCSHLCARIGTDIEQTTRSKIEAVLASTPRQDPFERCRKLIKKIEDKEWESVNALLQGQPDILTLHVPGQGSALQHLSVVLPLLPSDVLEVVIACSPNAWRNLESNQGAIVHRTLKSGGSSLAGVDPHSIPLREEDIGTLARVAVGKQLPSLVWAGLQLGDTGAQQLLRYLTISPECSVVSLDLRDNGLTTLPQELVRLKHLGKLLIDGNPALEAVAKILVERGVQGVFDYIGDLYDDPQPSFYLKVVLAGPSMAGKSSLLNALNLRQARLTHPQDGRTIGLDIKVCVASQHDLITTINCILMSNMIRSGSSFMTHGPSAVGLSFSHTMQVGTMSTRKCFSPFLRRTRCIYWCGMLPYRTVNEMRPSTRCKSSKQAGRHSSKRVLRGQRCFSLPAMPTKL